MKVSSHMKTEVLLKTAASDKQTQKIFKLFEIKCNQL